jgi:hypothetical protein
LLIISWSTLLKTGALKLLMVGLSFVGPVLLGYLVRYIEAVNDKEKENITRHDVLHGAALLLSLVRFVCKFCSAFCILFLLSSLFLILFPSLSALIPALYSALYFNPLGIIAISP